MKHVRTFFKFIAHYYKFSLAMAAVIAGLVLQAYELNAIRDWVLAITAGLACLPLAKSMIDDVRSGTYGIDILALVAIIASILLKEYWAAIVIVVMYTGGEALEDYAEHRAESELDSLLNQAPQQAIVLLTRDRQQTIPAKQVKVGDRVLVRPGDVVPVDGEIIDGESSFDESALTGESLPQAKAAGDSLLSGSVNVDGAVTIKCTHRAADSQYEQIIKLVKAARGSQAPFVRLADRYSIPFTLFAFTLALGVWAISGEPRRFLEVIVVATPCPLLLAAPIAIISGMSRSAKHGIIVRTGGALERLAQARSFAFDKTGTLTTGKLEVASVVAFGRRKKDDIVQLAAQLEQHSNHVLAAAITGYAQQRSLKLGRVKRVQEISGRGLQAQVGKEDVLVGRFSFMQLSDVTIPDTFKPKSVEQTATYVAVNGELAGYITFDDTIRPESKPTIDKLRAAGIKTIMMVTGDNTATARRIGKLVGINKQDITAEALPVDKLRAIETLPDKPVVFVGDGVNDAPVLTGSGVGIALGARGSTAASESADVVILQDDLSRVAAARNIARYTFRIARQSILIGIGLSIGLMLAFATGKFSPLLGALLQEVVDVVVIINALRAHSRKPI